MSASRGQTLCLSCLSLYSLPSLCRFLLKQYFKQYENDKSITEEERKPYINKEIIYDNIREKCEVKNTRILSTICVVNIVIELLCICFKENLYSLLKYSNFNTMSIFSLTILIIDMCYKEKISNKILQIYYNKALKNNNKFKLKSIVLKMGLNEKI